MGVICILFDFFSYKNELFVEAFWGESESGIFLEWIRAVFAILHQFVSRIPIAERTRLNFNVSVSFFVFVWFYQKLVIGFWFRKPHKIRANISALRIVVI